MNLFSAMNARDPHVNWIYNTLANFDKIRTADPGIETLPQAMIVYAKLEVLKTLRAEIEKINTGSLN